MEHVDDAAADAVAAHARDWLSLLKERLQPKGGLLKAKRVVGDNRWISLSATAVVA